MLTLTAQLIQMNQTKRIKQLTLGTQLLQAQILKATVVSNSLYLKKNTKYSVLRVEDEENLEKNEDIAAKQDRENSQSTSDKSSLKESAFNKRGGVTKEQKLIRSLSVTQ